MSLAKKAISTGLAATMLASLLATAMVGSVAAVEGPFGTAFPFTGNKAEAVANGTDYIALDFAAVGTPPSTTACGGPCTVTVVNLQVTGGQIINAAPAFAVTPALTYPRTQILLTGPDVALLFGKQLWLASNTAGTATVTVTYTYISTPPSTTTTLPDSTASFTFTSASVNVPSTALSTNFLCDNVDATTTPDTVLAPPCPAANQLSSPASSTKAAGEKPLFLETKVLASNGSVISSGVTVEWTITGPAFFTGGNFKATDGTPVNVDTGAAKGSHFQSPTITSTGAGGVATITTTIKYLGVSYALGDKVVNFVGDVATVTAENSRYSIITNSSTTDDGIFVTVKDANGFNITSGVTFEAVNITPAAFWSLKGTSYFDNDDKGWYVDVQCGPTAGSASAQIKVTTGTKSVTSTESVPIACATELSSVNPGTMTVTSTATTVAPNGQLEVTVNVKDKNGLPAPDGSLTSGRQVIVTAVTNGVGNVVNATTGGNQRAVSNGIARFIYLAPPTTGTAVVTFFVSGTARTVPSNVSLTLGIGQAVNQPLGVTVKAGLPSEGGTYGTATPVVAPGKYITWRGQTTANAAGQVVGIYVAVKNADGTWGPFNRLTGRTIDATGQALFWWRSSTPTWVSVRFGIESGTSTLFSVARQGRWR